MFVINCSCVGPKLGSCQILTQYVGSFFSSMNSPPASQLCGSTFFFFVWGPICAGCGLHQYVIKLSYIKWETQMGFLPSSHPPICNVIKLSYRMRNTDGFPSHPGIPVHRWVSLNSPPASQLCGSLFFLLGVGPDLCRLWAQPICDKVEL